MSRRELKVTENAAPPKKVERRFIWPKETMHGEFLLNGKVRKYAFMTAADMASKAEINRLLAVWKLTPPNLTVQLNCHSTQPMNIVTAEMLQAESYQRFMQSLGGEKPVEAIQAHVLNRVRSMFGGVAVACDMTNSWIVHKGVPTTNHYIMDRAIEENQASPVFLAVDNFLQYADLQVGDSDCGDRLKAFQSELLKVAKTLKEQAGQDQPAMQLSPGGQLPPDAAYGQISSGPDGEVNLEDREKIETEIPPEYRLDHFMEPWKTATHFIFSEKYGDFNPTMLGNSGYILVGGGATFKHECLLQAMQTGSPAVLVDNTGKETQQYARLIAEMRRLREKEGLVEAAQLRGKAKHLLDFATLGTKSYPDGTYGMTQMTLPEVLRMIDLICAKPTYFKETLKIVDVLEDSADVIVQKVSKSFASKTTHAYEMGSGDADTNLMNETWRLHMLLTTNSCRLWWRDAILISLAALFTLLGTMSSVMIAVLETRKKEEAPSWLEFFGLKDFDDIADELGLVSIFAPALATLFGGAAVALRCRSQSTALHGAAAAIMNEIFCFRMRVGPYDIATAKTPAKGGDGPAEMNESMRLKLARGAFQKRIESFASTMGVGAPVDAEMQYQEELCDLDEYVEKECYGERLSLEKILGHKSNDPSQPLLMASQAFEIEHLRCMSSVAYYFTRVLPLLALYCCVQRCMVRACLLYLVFVDCCKNPQSKH
eukprot:TRINITY_DN8932_c0_g1_i1.p1 TRINITY_DN8932_c0_g1~~TRINITY_DN8932_c0_g1_i1.p1  ORF type:complete len:731 (-),score=128.60 TRINITY_DN8932_c0_g1_i1:105-2240(-)